MDLMSQDAIVLDPDDLAAEIEIDLNTSLSYSGITPYQCLYGVLPRAVFTDEMEGLSAYTDAEPFYEMQQIRLRSCQAFQQAIIKYRVQKAVTTRPRKENSSSYKVGDLVDFYRKPKAKDLQGWRGPGVIIQVHGEGLLCIRWQSMIFDTPVHLVRPHISITVTKPVEKNPLQQYVQDIEKEEQAEDQQTVAYVDSRQKWELFYSEEIADQLAENEGTVCLDTLVSLTASLPAGGTQVHAIDNRTNSKVQFSRDALRDGLNVFKVGQQLATHFRSDGAYMGVTLSNGRRQLQAAKHAATCQILWWSSSTDNMQQMTVSGAEAVDFFLHCNEKSWKDLKCICFVFRPRQL